MSLKAKIEAVIYASEEPVTLAQLVGLLGEEAQAELERSATQQALALSEAELQAEAAEPSLGPDFDAVTGEPVETLAVAEELNAADGEASDATRDEETDTAGTPDSVAAADAAAAKADKAQSGRLRAHFRSALDELIAEYSAAESDRGIEIREVAGGFRFATKPEYHDTVRGFVKSLKPPLKLTLQALETLAVVAYKQPVTAPEISEIRGVDSSGTLSSLIARKLITTAGRKHVIGRPMLYKTTKEFLLKFGLKDVGELPSIEEFEKMAGQLAEQEEIPMGDTAGPHDAPESAAELEQERDEHMPQADGDSGAAGNVSEETGDRASVDGRISSLPPDYEGEELREDPSALDAEIQSGKE